MTDAAIANKSNNAWTLKKAVTTLAIAPQTDSLTRTGRLAYNVMIYKAQRAGTPVDDMGGYSAPMSEIVKGFGATTRDSGRVKEYIEKMCTTPVKWYPLSASDASLFPQGSALTDKQQAASTNGGGQLQIPGTEAGSPDVVEEERIFNLLAEARFDRRGGEQWVTWYFPPTIRQFVIDPARWAQVDLRELSALSRYASVALYEVCVRYKDSPGGLTNREPPEWWMTILRADNKETKREWRKFKNETLKPALAEISQRTSLEVKLVELKRGKAVSEVQFAVKKRREEQAPGPVDLTLVERADGLGIKERDLDQLVDEFGEAMVVKVMDGMESRNRVLSKEKINSPIAYMRKSLRAGASSMFDDRREPKRMLSAKEAAAGAMAGAHEDERPSQASAVPDHRRENEWRAERLRELDLELDEFAAEDLEALASRARLRMAQSNLLTAGAQKRFETKQFRSPLIWTWIRQTYGEEKYGKGWSGSPTAP